MDFRFSSETRKKISEFAMKLLQLLELPAPLLNFSPNGSYVTESGNPFDVKDVHLWKDFSNEVLAFDLDNLQEYASPSFFHADAPRSIEAEVMLPFTINFGLRLNILGVDLHCEYSTDGSGRADVLLRKGMAKLPCEIKFPRDRWLFVNDLAECYKREQNSLSKRNDEWSKVIRQIFTYMVRLETRYGVISTYEGTWFVRRKPGSELEVEISSRFYPESQNPSVARCLWYLLNREDHRFRDNIMPDLYVAPKEDSGSSGPERSDPEDKSYRRPSQRRREDEAEDDSRPRKSPRLTKETVESLQENLAVECRESKEMFARGRWMGQPCTVVFVPSLDDLDSVVSAMDTLEKLQGQRIPKLLSYGIVNSRYVLVLQPDIEPVGKDPRESMSDPEKVEASEAMRQIHRYRLFFGSEARLNAKCLFRCTTVDGCLSELTSEEELQSQSESVKCEFETMSQAESKCESQSESTKSLYEMMPPAESTCESELKSRSQLGSQSGPKSRKPKSFLLPLFGLIEGTGRDAVSLDSNILRELLYVTGGQARQ